MIQFTHHCPVESFSPLLLGGLLAFPHHHTGASLVRNVTVLTLREKETIRQDPSSIITVSEEHVSRLKDNYSGAQQVLSQRLRGHLLHHQIPAVFIHTEEKKCMNLLNWTNIQNIMKQACSGSR